MFGAGARFESLLITCCELRAAESTGGASGTRRVDSNERKIGLSRKRVEWAEGEGEEDAAAAGDTSGSSIPAAELKGGVGSGSGPLFKAAGQSEE